MIYAYVYNIPKHWLNPAIIIYKNQNKSPQMHSQQRNSLKNYLSECTQKQSPLTTVCIYKYESKILHMIRSCQNHIIYLTEQYLTIVRIDDIILRDEESKSADKNVVRVQIQGATVLRMVLNWQETQFAAKDQDKGKQKISHPIEKTAHWKNNRVFFIAILYKNAILEIRDLSGQIKWTFSDVEMGSGGEIRWPQLYWNYDDIYVLSENKLQLFNGVQKKRKVYSDLIDANQSKNLLGLCESRFLEHDRILIFPFTNKLCFSILPTPWTQLDLPFELTKFLSFRIEQPLTTMPISSNSTNSSTRKFDQYLILVLANKLLRVYSVFSMTIIMEIQYDTNEHEIIQTSMDWKKQFLLVSFLTKKNKVTRNLLYRINQQYKGQILGKNQNLNKKSGKPQQVYSSDGKKSPKDPKITKRQEKQSDETQKIFEYEIQIQMRQKLYLIGGKSLPYGEKKMVAVYFGHIRHYTKRGKGEVLISVLLINEQVAKTKPIPNCTTHNQSWKQFSQWKSLLCSYNQNKNTMDQLNQILTKLQKADKPQRADKPERTEKPPKAQQVQQAQQQIHGQRPKTTLSNHPIPSLSKSSPILDMLAFDAQNERIKRYLLIEEQQLELQKYERLKDSLAQETNKFKEMIYTHKDHSDYEGRITEEFYNFMAKYLKANNLDINTDIRSQAEEIQTKNNKNSNQNSIYTPTSKYLQALYNTPQSKAEIREREKQKQKQKQKQKDKEKEKEKEKERQKLIEEEKEKLIQKEKGKKKLEKPIISESKSSQRLAKDTSNSSYLNRTKSSTNEQFESNVKNPDNKSMLSQLSYAKLQVITKSEQNVQKEAQSDSEDEYLDKMSKTITDSIQKAFQPLQQRLNTLQSHLKQTESLHLHHLQTLARSSATQNSYLSSLDMKINGYCQQLILQFDNNLQSGLKSYWTRIEQLDKKSARERDKCVGSFGLFIDQQIKAREDIFDSGRVLVENSLAHLRKKIGRVFDFGDLESEEQEDEMEGDWMFNKLMKQDYGFGQDIEQNDEEWKGPTNK